MERMENFAPGYSNPAARRFTRLWSTCYRRRFYTIYMVFMCLLTAGCSQSFDSSDRAGVVRPISGKIHIIAVEPWLNSAVVSFNGRQYIAWWDNFSAFYTNGHFTHKMPEQADCDYHFDGLETDQDLYLGQVWGNQTPPQFHGFSTQKEQPQIQRERLPGQTIMSAKPIQVQSGLKLPTTKPSTYRVPNKQHKIPLPTQLGSS